MIFLQQIEEHCWLSIEERTDLSYRKMAQRFSFSFNKIINLRLHESTSSVKKKKKKKKSFTFS